MGGYNQPSAVKFCIQSSQWRDKMRFRLRTRLLTRHPLTTKSWKGHTNPTPSSHTVTSRVFTKFISLNFLFLSPVFSYLWQSGSILFLFLSASKVCFNHMLLFFFFVLILSSVMGLCSVSLFVFLFLFLGYPSAVQFSFLFIFFSAPQRWFCVLFSLICCFLFFDFFSRFCLPYYGRCSVFIFFFFYPTGKVAFFVGFLDRWWSANGSLL